MYQLQIDVRGARLVPINESKIKKLVVVDKKCNIELRNKHYYDVIKILKDTSPQDNKGICFVEAKHLDNCLECRKISNLEQFNQIEVDISDAINKKVHDLGFEHINTPIKAVEGFAWLDFKCEDNIVIPKYPHWWQQAHGKIIKTFDPIIAHDIKIEIFAKVITNEELDSFKH